LTCAAAKVPSVEKADIITLISKSPEYRSAIDSAPDNDDIKTFIPNCIPGFISNAHIDTLKILFENQYKSVSFLRS
jgi:hypothetical protein